jgi:hypothetical protein
MIYLIAIGDYKVDLPRGDDFGQMLDNNIKSCFTNDFTNKENPHPSSQNMGTAGPPHNTAPAEKSNAIVTIRTTNCSTWNSTKIPISIKAVSCR